MTQRNNHTTHHACKEVVERDGGKAVGCCCTGHDCKRDDPLPSELLTEWIVQNSNLIEETGNAVWREFEVHDFRNSLGILIKQEVKKAIDQYEHNLKQLSEGDK